MVIDVPVALTSAEPALVVGLWAFGLLGLSSDLHSNALIIDVLAIHLIDSLDVGILGLKHLHEAKHTMKA